VELRSIRGGGPGGDRRQKARRAAGARPSVASALEAGTGFAQAMQPADAKADIVFRNGPVYTVNGAQAWARAVAVQLTRIVYVGADAGVQGFVGAATRVVDLRGRMLLPGFVEGHIHPVVGATVTRGVDLQYDTRDETLRALETYRSNSGNADIIRGFGWRYSAFPPTGPRKEDLDRIWPDIQVMLLAVDGHSGWVNSKTLELAGVTRETRRIVAIDCFPSRQVVTNDRRKPCRGHSARCLEGKRSICAAAITCCSTLMRLSGLPSAAPSRRDTTWVAHR
jgi:Amidohydrolase family